MANATTVSVIGLGYIGLPTAAVMAKHGLSVIGVDINTDIIKTLNRGDIHIIEPHLKKLIADVKQSGRLSLSSTPPPSDVFMIAVPTPFKGQFEPDLHYVESAIDSILPVLEKDNLVIIESTCPVGTTEKMYAKILKSRPELVSAIHIAYCPERVLPGNILYELEHNDRVIGGITEKSTQLACDFYKTFVSGKLLPTNANTAELCKLTENSFRDVNIAFANELSFICDKAGVDVWELIHLANHHPRVNILKPSTGVGGHCIAVDPWFIVSDFKRDAELINKARLINDSKPSWVTEHIRTHILEYKLAHGKTPVVGLLGLAFKPNIDDLRESPALSVAQSLVASQVADFRPVEPHISPHASLELFDLTQTVNDADILCYLVAHDDFKTISSNQDVLELDYCGVRQ